MTSHQTSVNRRSDAPGPGSRSRPAPELFRPLVAGTLREAKGEVPRVKVAGSRRSLRSLGASLATAVVAAACVGSADLPERVTAPPLPSPAGPSGIHKIEHVIIVIQ